MKNDFSFDEFSPDDEPEFEITIEQITEDAREAIAIQETIAELESEIAELNQRFRHLTENRIPYAMKETGMSQYSLTDGSVIKVREKIQAPQLDERKPFYPFAKQYLMERGELDILKTDVSLQFGRGSHNEVLSLVADLKDKGYTPTVIDKALAQTYTKFGNELLEEYKENLKKGVSTEEPPFKELGMFRVNKAEIKIPKKGK